MAIIRIRGNTKFAIDDTNNKLHVVTETTNAQIDRGVVVLQ